MGVGAEETDTSLRTTIDKLAAQPRTHRHPRRRLLQLHRHALRRPRGAARSGLRLRPQGGHRQGLPQEGGRSTATPTPAPTSSSTSPSSDFLKRIRQAAPRRHAAQARLLRRHHRRADTASCGRPSRRRWPSTASRPRASSSTSATTSSPPTTTSANSTASTPTPPRSSSSCSSTKAAKAGTAARSSAWPSSASPSRRVFVLQATMRCLRSIGDAQQTGHVYLIDENLEILNDELQQNFRISADELQHDGQRQGARGGARGRAAGQDQAGAGAQAVRDAREETRPGPAPGASSASTKKAWNTWSRSTG